MRHFCVAMVTLFLTTNLAQADVRLPGFFSDHMILQRDQPNFIWGWADPEEKVTLRFNGDVFTDTAGPNGTWVVHVPATPLGDPHTLVIEGKNTITLSDILMGDVWVCSGQSNMGWPVGKSKDAKKEIAAANYPILRYFRVTPTVGLTEQDDIKGSWRLTTPNVAAGYSAVAYYFGREIHQELDVPIGLLATAWGGTPVEAWTSQRAAARSTTFKRLNDDWAPDMARVGEELLSYYNNRGKDRIPLPETKRRLGNAPGVPSFTYNAMVAPLWRFGIKGTIWYQGEGNSSRAYQYRDLMQTMILDWRAQFNQGDFPFIITQLANYRPRAESPGASMWAELREAQSIATKLPNVGLAVAIDAGDAEDIHPKDKQVVGYRLAQSALNIAYGKDVLPAGPTYAGMKVQGSTIVLSFDHVGGGLTTWNRQAGEATGSDGRTEPPITGFAIAGDDGEFVWAQAVIKGKKVHVSSELVPNPVAARYGWADNPACNLYNTRNRLLAAYKSPHLPASPFRTDDFPMITRDKW
jgi:sialate O-acetylesterase